MRWIDLKEGLNNERQVIRVGVRDPCKLSSYHFLEQSWHILCLKGWMKSYHFVYDTTKWPYVTLDIIRLVLPNLRTCIVRGPCLGIVEAFLVCNLWHIHVSKLHCEILIQENVSTLEISMHYVQVMHCSKPVGYLYQDWPHLWFIESLPNLLVISNLLKEVSIICKLHYDAKVLLDQSNISTYQRDFVFGSMNASLYEMTFTWLIDARIRTSLIAF